MLSTLLALVSTLLPAAHAPAAKAPPPCRPCVFGRRQHARAVRQLRFARWYLRRAHATRPYRSWLWSTRWCESHGDYTTNTGNGFYGAYQFALGTWYAVGGHGYPHQAPPLEQDYRAVKLLVAGGPGHWPVCG